MRDDLLDRLNVPTVVVAGAARPTCWVTGSVGFILGATLHLTLSARLGLSMSTAAAIVVAAAAAFFSLTVAIKVVTGDERLTYYHHEIAILVSAAAVAHACGEPLVPYLDVTILGIGTFFVFGRIGCFTAGCCHGRPATWGVRYRDVHAAGGFPACFLGVRLVPVQLMESLWLLATVAAGVGLVCGGAPSGSALASYTVAYGIGRFAFEFLRGDSVRRYFGPFSEAQWTSLALISVLAVAELAGAVPRTPWTIVGAVGLAGSMLAVAALERSEDRLFRAGHLREIAELIVAAQDRTLATGEIHIGETTLGLRLSAGVVAEADGNPELIVVSLRHRALRPPTVARLARLIARLRHCGSWEQFAGGKDGIHHLVLPRRAHAL